MWYVYWDKGKSLYQLANEDTRPLDWLAIFKNFDMAYDYVTKANKMTDVMSYSRWAR